MKIGDFIRHKHSRWVGKVHRIQEDGLWVNNGGHVMFGRFFTYEKVTITEILNSIMDQDDHLCVEINMAIENQGISKQQVKDWIFECSDRETLDKLFDLYEFISTFDVSYAG